MSEHTPGPWTATASTPADGYEFFEIVQASRYVGTVNGPQDAEGKANARIIAASPDLLEALENLLDASEKYIFSTECQIQRESARAAIAKARGKE